MWPSMPTTERTRLTRLLLCAMLALPANTVLAQGGIGSSGSGTAPAPSPRILGTVTALAGNSITVHQEGASAGDTTVTATPQTRLLRTAPGETSLKNATPMTIGDLAVGDRVLIRVAADGSAGVLVAMKQGDISQAHEQASADWQQHGVTGIVQQMDTGAGTVTLRPQAGAEPLVIQTTPATIVRRYAADSTAFADAHKAALADIHPGDQLRARGQKDGSQVAAVEIVTGSFRNIAGTVVGTDAAANSLTLTDLATKRPVTLRLEPTAQLRKLPPEMAARLARRGSSGGSGAAGGAGTPGSRPVPTAEGAPAAGAPAQPSERPRDTAAMLQRAPVIALADLKKGDAVMVVASGPEAKQPVALTVIAGVEPLLQASPEASAGLFSASWNLGGGGEAGGGEAAPQR